MTKDINVLVVDDIDQNLVAMEALLTRPGVRVLKAASGVVALELLLSYEVALALLDVNMPEMGGFELAELMQNNSKTRTIPIVFITAARNEAAHTFKGYRAGAVDFLNKPFDPEILLSKVNVFLELYAQRRQMAQQLADLEKALEVNELFTAVLGHDLRTPLAAVMNGAELISMLGEQHPKVLSAAKMIRSSSKRMENMIRQLLDTAKVRSESIKLNLSAGNYEKVCRQIILEFEHSYDPRDITLIKDGDTSGSFDVDRISQIFSNLIGNALQHGKQGSPVSVRIDGSCKEKVIIDFHNKGHIPTSEMTKIFEPYHSVQAGKSHPSGLGLGLYIVKHFVDAHGGSIKAHSSFACGTSFSVNIPRNPVPRD